jgi:hypothetical protein
VALEQLLARGLVTVGPGSQQVGVGLRGVSHRARVLPRPPDARCQRSSPAHQRRISQKF